MTRTKNTAVGLCTLLATVSGAIASTDLELARSYSLAEAASEYDAINSFTSNIKVSAQVQARYQVNSRDDASTALTMPDDDLTVGFVIRRAKVAISGDVAENMKGKLQFAFDRSTGMGALEDAVLAWAVNDDLTIRVGQFKPGVMREELVSSKKQLSAERSSMNETFNQDFTQGVEFGFGGDNWRAAVSLNDGFGTDNTPFTSGSEADFGVSGRVEFLVGGAEFGQFKQFTSFRGSAQGGMLGAAVAFQSMGDTNPSTTDSEMTTGTVDFSYVGDGWNLYAAGVWRNIDAGSGSEADDYGVLVQGGLFVSDQDELYARWDAIFPDDSNGSMSDDFNALTFGWNHYFTPESHAAKFTLDFNYYLDATSTSIVSTSSSGSHNLQSSTEDGQFGMTAQMQFLF